MSEFNPPEHERIEQIARGMYESELRFFPPRPWRELQSSTRDWWTKIARERLESAGLLPFPSDEQVRHFRELCA